MKTPVLLLNILVIIFSQAAIADFVGGYEVSYRCGKFEYKVSVPDNGCDDTLECGDSSDAYSYFVKQGKTLFELKAVKGKPLVHKGQKVYFDGAQLSLDKEHKKLCKKMGTSSL